MSVFLIVCGNFLWHEINFEFCIRHANVFNVRIFICSGGNVIVHSDDGIKRSVNMIFNRLGEQIERKQKRNREIL